MQPVEATTYQTKLIGNSLSKDDFRTYYDYRADVPTERLSENDHEGSQFTVDYIEPEVESVEDQWTLILLHGLNSSGKSMANMANAWRSRFPHLRVVLPTATRIPVTMNLNMPMPAWHDVYEIGTEALPPRGWPQMAHSVTRVRALIRDEQARGVPAHRVLLAGFSQGAHLALATAFNSEVRLGGVVALSGWYPNPDVESAAEEVRRAVNKDMPVFTAHGTDDSVVLYKAAEGTRTALARGGASVYHHRYEGMEHIYTGDVLADAGDFIGMVTEGTWWPRNVVVSHPYRGRKSGSK